MILCNGGVRCVMAMCGVMVVCSTVGEDLHSKWYCSSEGGSQSGEKNGEKHGEKQGEKQGMTGRIVFRFDQISCNLFSYILLNLIK